jgi:stalled ribosome alternative rescue factor ArfA
MRAAKMMCGQRKRPVALKGGGNPVAKTLASPALKPKVVKPKKGKGSYSRKAPSVKGMKSGGKTAKPKKIKTPKGSPSFNIARTFMGKKPVSYSKARAYDNGGEIQKMKSGGEAIRSSGKNMLEGIRSRTPKTGEKAKARMESQKKYVEEQNKKPPRSMKSGGKTKSTVNKAGNYTKPTMRKSLFNKIKAGGKGGSPGQWSARKAQMLAQQYKKAGGGYRD